VARRYALNANLVFKWLRDPRFAPDPDAAPAEGPCFLPVEIVERPAEGVSPAAGDARDPGGTIEIDVAGGHLMRISGRYDPEVLVRLIRGLSG
jgi:transposase